MSSKSNKNILQEFCVSKGLFSPQYFSESHGEQHKPYWSSNVTVGDLKFNNKLFGHLTKVSAEQDAAYEAYKYFTSELNCDKVSSNILKPEKNNDSKFIVLIDLEVLSFNLEQLETILNQKSIEEYHIFYSKLPNFEIEKYKHDNVFLYESKSNDDCTIVSLISCCIGKLLTKKPFVSKYIIISRHDVYTVLYSLLEYEGISVKQCNTDIFTFPTFLNMYA